MTRENALSFIPLVEAFAAGKTIQYKNGPNSWADMPDPSFSSPPEYYRVSPEPREYWLCDKRICGTKGEAIRHQDWCRLGTLRPEIIHIREVLPPQ